MPNNKNFNVYFHQKLGFASVKIGFSWPAFFFGVIWYVFKKMWAYVLVWFLSALIFSFIADESYHSIVNAFWSLVYLTIFWLIPGLKANKWLESTLRSKGYKLITTVPAVSGEAALLEVVDLKTKFEPENFGMPSNLQP